MRSEQGSVDEMIPKLRRELHGAMVAVTCNFQPFQSRCQDTSTSHFHYRLDELDMPEVWKPIYRRRIFMLLIDDIFVHCETLDSVGNIFYVDLLPSVSALQIQMSEA
jgi:hypothetical protein